MPESKNANLPGGGAPASASVDPFSIVGSPADSAAAEGSLRKPEAYPDVPGMTEEAWRNIPEDVRPKVEAALKAGAEAAATLRNLGDVNALREKARYFELIAAEPELAAVVEAHFRGERVPKAQPASGAPAFGELGIDDPEKFQTALNAHIQSQLKPITDQLRQLTQVIDQVAGMVSRRELAVQREELRRKYPKDAYPPVDDLWDQMIKLLADGKVPDIETAYRALAFEKLPETIKGALAQKVEQSAALAARTVGEPSPGVTPGRIGIRAPRVSMREALLEAAREHGVKLKED